MRSDQAEQSRERYRQNFDRISWSNTPRPAYQGGIQRLMVAPLGTIIDFDACPGGQFPGSEGSRIPDGHGGQMILIRPKITPSNLVS